MAVVGQTWLLHSALHGTPEDNSSSPLTLGWDAGGLLKERISNEEASEFFSFIKRKVNLVRNPMNHKHCLGIFSAIDKNCPIVQIRLRIECRDRIT
ncbi:hypothetical protein AVEN_106241-1 [Araneus ventricosus]|uniref:Uncharacterized protein n=1 Tax=Araneus ventricosus TaxID=182803 RepID=A0A4Y2HI78_ARAVE|nr:hypothetical protein AVEN_106241-1 [Araneus ventricosus]